MMIGLPLLTILDIGVGKFSPRDANVSFSDHKAHILWGGMVRHIETYYSSPPPGNARHKKHNPLLSESVIIRPPKFPRNLSRATFNIGSKYFRHLVIGLPFFFLHYWAGDFSPREDLVDIFIIKFRY